MMNAPIKYVAELSHVREVSLLGTADLDYWTARLRTEGLVPAESNGRAQVLVIAADAKFKGVRFREVSFSVFVRVPGGGAGREACFLAHAFNSSRFFAFCERAFFATPYSYASAQLVTCIPAGFRITAGGQAMFEARMRTDDPGREPASRGPGGWDGPVFLPAGRRSKGNVGDVFYARISGDTLTFPFQCGADSLTVTPAEGAGGILRELLDSGFAAKQWMVRWDASHAKSKTYTRDQLGLGGS
jgi:hypothetical protein